MKKRRIGTALVGLGLVLGLFSNAAFAYTGTYQVGGNNSVPYGELSTHDTSNSATTNSNQTGQGVNSNDGSTKQGVVKGDNNLTRNDGTVGTQRTHGEYQTNTDSCASCHQTHTANGDTLLFKDGVYNTCTACHDGTLGFYNVFQNGKQASTAGTFGGTTDGNMSAHLATGALQIKAAPGGNTGANSGTWTGEFDCASCHAPHGSYSDRLLNYNPNNMGNSTQDQGGVKTVGQIYTLPAPTTQQTDPASNKPANYITVRATWADIKASYKSTANNNTIQDADTVVLVYKWNGKNAYVPNAGVPLIYGSDYGSPYKGWYTRLYKTTDGWTAIPSLYQAGDASKVIDPNTNNPNSTGVNFDYADGYIWAPAGSAGATTLASAQSASMAQAYVVKFDLVKVADFGGVPITYNNEAALHGGALDANGTIKADATLTAQWSKSGNGSGMGVALNKFCVACHTDYFSTDATALSGTFSQNYRHVTNSDSYTCVRCHFAHGTDVAVMKDSLGRTIRDLQNVTNPATGQNWTASDATAYMLDKNPDSALKRYTNMAVCWGCHTSSHADQFKNSSFYWNGAAAGTNPAGLTDSQTPTQMDQAGTLPYGSTSTPTNVQPSGTTLYNN